MMTEMTEVERGLGVLHWQTSILNLTQLDPLVRVQRDKLLASLLSGLLDVVEEVEFEVHQPHHVALLVLHPLPNVTRDIVNLNVIVADAILCSLKRGVALKGRC